MLSKYLNSPTDTHMKHAKRLLIHLYTTRKELTCSRDTSLNGNILGMSDWHFAGDIDNRKSQTGWIFMHNGSAISWRSYQQYCAALSAPEAEYLAASEAAKRGRSLLKLASNILNKKSKLLLSVWMIVLPSYGLGSPSSHLKLSTWELSPLKG